MSDDYGKPRAFESIVYSGLVVGILDGLDALFFFGLRGSRPASIFQYIASGLLGRSAFAGGWKTTVLGVILHFLVAFILAAIFYFLSLVFPILIRRAVLAGLVYGPIAHIVIFFVVTPLSAAPRIQFRIAPFINGIVGHALLVGLPSALITRRSAHRNALS